MSSVSEGTVTADSEPLSIAVITAIAEHKGVDPTELDPPLYEAVDPDAMAALFSGQRCGTGSAAVRLMFSYDGYEVRVTSEGDVRVSASNDR